MTILTTTDILLPKLVLNFKVEYVGAIRNDYQGAFHMQNIRNRTR
jgi:hypothetical protein